MSKARRWVIIVLSLAVLVMIGINMAEKDDTAQVVVNNNDPTYKSEHTDTLVYNPEGALSYRLMLNTLNIIPIRPFRGLRSRYLPRLIRIKSRHGP